jgi:ATP-dependent Zn protease
MKERKMTDMAHHHCTRPWYMRPPVWVLSLVVIGLIVFGIVEETGGPPATPYSNFLTQLDASNVASVTFQGTRIDGRFKHPLAASTANGKEQSAFHSRVPDIGDPTLLPELRKEHVTIDVEASSNWTAWLGRLPWPMVVFIAFILVAGFARLVRGRGAAAGAPMHPPMMALFSGLFGRQDQATPTAGGDGDAGKSR